VLLYNYTIITFGCQYDEMEGKIFMLKKITRVLPALLLLLGLIGPMAQASPKSEISLDIYSVNDLRGALRKESDYPGVAELGGVIKTLRAENPNGTILLGGGNMLFGTIESDDRNGMPTVEAMNLMGFDANVTGSHFFDFKPDIFKEQLAIAKFPYLACNVEVKTGTPLFKPYTILERNGLKVGVIGVTTRTTLREASPANLANFTFIDSVTSTQKAIDEVRRQGANVVVLLMHCGVNQRAADGALRGEAIDILSRLKGADVCFTGDSQTLVTGRYNDIPVLQAGSHGRYIAKVHLIYDSDSKKVLTKREEMIVVANAPAPEDQAIANLVAPIAQAVDAKFGQVLAYNEKALTNHRDDQSTVAEYLTDLMRKDSKADFVIINGGAFRSDMPEGKVTARTIEEIYPYRGQAVLMSMKGIDILAALDYGVDNPLVGEGRYSGIKLAVEPDLGPGEKIVDNVLPNGDKIDPNKEYTVLTNSYMAQGGDGYTMFKNGKQLKVVAPDIKAYLRGLVQDAGTINYTTDYRFSVGELRG
jgi:5'-nucleotidase/UDP-sugar diphosphatase